MYATILMLAMSPATQPVEGILFNRGAGCNGTVAAASTGCAGAHIRTRVRAVVETTVRRPLATLLANRPRLFARGGCGGAVAAASTGCSGGFAVAVAQAPPAYQPMPQPEMEAGIFGKRIERAAVHRQLRIALRNGNMTAEQAKIAKRALDDPEIYEAAVSKVTHDLRTTKLPVGAGPVGKIGDGSLLKMLLDNLPAIIDAIKQILALFSSDMFPAFPSHYVAYHHLTNAIFAREAMLGYTASSISGPDVQNLLAC